MELKWAPILLFAALLSCGQTQDWQGAGNWTTDNLTTIRSKIFSLSSQTSNFEYAAKAENISNELNTLWHPAWNVFIVNFGDGNNYDAVLYGYGFNGHWFWFNGYKLEAGYVSFIIWKDYNCLKWWTFNSFGSARDRFEGMLGLSILNKVSQGKYNPVRSVSDIWLLAQDVQATIPTASASLLQDETAYSIVAAPTTLAYLFGRFCAKQYLVMQQIGNKPDGSTEGTVFIMQMRDQ